MLNQLRLTAKNSIVYSIGSMSGKLSGLILIPLYTQYLPVKEYGLLALLEVSYQFILAISGFGVKSALTRYYWDKDLAGKEKSLFFTSYLFNILTSFLTIIVFFFIIRNFASAIFGTELSKELIYYFIGSSLIRLLIDSPMLLMRIQQKAFRQTAVQLLILVITVSLTVYFISIKDMGIEGFFLAQMIASIAASFFLVKYIISNIRIHFDFPLLRELLNFGIPLFLSNLLSIILILSDRFILNIFGTLEDVGNFSLAFKISNIIQVIFVASFMNAYTHIFYKQMSEDNSGRFYSKSMTYFVLVIVCVGIGLMLFSKETIKILSMGNQDYWDSYTLIPVLVFGVVFGGIRQLLILPLSRLKKTRIISAVTISAAVLNFVLNLILIPLLNTIGAAISTAITQVLAAAWLYFLVNKHDTIEYEIPKILKCVILGILFYLVAVLIDDFALVWRLTGKSLVFVSFFFILYFWNFYEEIELKSLKGVWDKWSKLRNFRKNISEIKIEF